MEVRIFIPKNLEPLVDQIIRDGLILPTVKGGGVVRRLVEHLRPLRDERLIVGRDERNGKTILKAIKVKVVQKKKKWGRIEYLLALH
jgi:hypothetical protein